MNHAAEPCIRTGKPASGRRDASMMKNGFLRNMLFFVLLAAGFFCPGLDSEASSWTPLDGRAVLERAANVNAGSYPDADVVVLGRQSWVRYEPNGTSVQFFEQYAKVLTEKGRRESETLTSSFTLPYNTTAFELVEVISEDGTVRKVDIARNTKEMIDPSQMAANIYNPNDRLIQVSIGGLRTGDTVHFIVRDDFVKTQMPDTFSDYVTLEETSPILEARYTVVAPRARPLASMALKDEIKGTVSFAKTSDQDGTVYTWTARDVPRAFPEPRMPPLYTQAQRVLVSTIGDWGEISRWYWNLSRTHIQKVTPAMSKTVKGLTRGRATRDEKIRSIFFWVSRNVRYLGITAETEAPGYEPHPVSMTFERRAGVCRDKAALLVAMLRLAGFEAYPVLIMRGPRKDPEVPQPFFNHAIACVRNPDGSYLLMDPTDENTRELFPAYLGNQSYLVASPRGDALRTSPVEPAERNAMRISTEGVIDASGTLRASTLLCFGGVNDNAYRGNLSTMSLQERRLFFEKILKKVVPAAVLTDAVVSPAQVTDSSKPLEARISYTADRFVLRGAGVNTVAAPRFGAAVGLVPFLVRDMGLKQRRYPYVTDMTCSVDETLRMELDGTLGTPEGSPLERSLADSGCSWQRTCRIRGRTLEMKDAFSMRLTEYSPDEYRRLQDSLASVERADRLAPTLRFPGEPGPGEAWYGPYSADAVVVSDKRHVRIRDRDTSIETVERDVRVLTYAGIKSLSELHVAYNPAWEDASLKYAFVRSPGGEVRKVDPLEVNVMDQAWVGTAPRYPAGKIMVVSFPGLEKGSTISYGYQVSRNKRVDGLILEGFQGQYPVEAKALSVETASSAPIEVFRQDGGFNGMDSWRPFESGYIRETREEADGKEVVRFSVSKVPPLKREDCLPEPVTYVPAAALSTLSARETAGLLERAVARCAGENVLASARAGQICRGIHSRRGKVQAVWRYVARNVRQVDVDFADCVPYMLSPADTTLTDGYGHQADRAVLAGAMLASLGLKPRYVLATRIPSGDRLIDLARRSASPGLFDAVLVKVRTEAGDVYVGDADQYAPLGATAFDGMYGFDPSSMTWEVIDTGGQDLKNATRTRVTVELGPRGDAVVSFDRAYFGINASGFVKAYEEMTPEEKRRRFEEIVTSVSRSAVAVGPHEVSTGDYPPHEAYKLSIPGYASVDGGLMTFFMPALARGLPFVSPGSRSNPVGMASSSRSMVRVEVLLPLETLDVVSMPGGTHEAGVGGVVSVRVDAALRNDPRGKAVVVEQDMRVSPGTIWPDGYPDLVNLHNRLASPEASGVVVRLGGGREGQVPKADGRE
jgi:transglutaminase-like putative cysteine protease